MRPGAGRTAAQALYTFLPDLENFNFKTEVVHGLPIPAGDLPPVVPLRRPLHGLHPRPRRPRLPAAGFHLRRGGTDDRHEKKTRGGQGLGHVPPGPHPPRHVRLVHGPQDEDGRHRPEESPRLVHHLHPLGQVPPLRHLRLPGPRRRPHLPLGHPVLQHADDRRPLRPPRPHLRHHRRARPGLHRPLRDRSPDRHGRGPRHQARLQDPGRRARPGTPGSGSCPSRPGTSP